MARSAVRRSRRTPKRGRSRRRRTAAGRSLRQRWLRRATVALPLLLLVGWPLLAPFQRVPYAWPPDPDLSGVPFRRDAYGIWADDDGNCRDTRAEVLIRESRVAVSLSPDGCRVIAGEWQDPYTGSIFTDPGMLDVDHAVPLSEAHRSGAAAWPAARKARYGNDLADPDTLIAVSRSANRSKGDRDPGRWMPPNIGHRCAYARMWRRVKAAWTLSLDPLEAWTLFWIDWGCGQGDAAAPRDARD